MAKKRKKIHGGCDLPPEGMWISPSGRKYEITEHLLALRERPDLFGLSRKDTAHADIPGLRAIAVDLIDSGWVRFRYLDNKWFFEVDNETRRHGTIEDVLTRCGAHSFEEVQISQTRPTLELSGTVADVFDRTIRRFETNPKRNKWRLS